MENLILSINVVLPLFLTMSLGYLMKKLNMFNDITVKTMNNITFKVFLPALLFYNVYNTNIKESFNLELMVFCVFSVICVFVLLCVIVPIIEKDNKKRGVLIQAIFRSNFVIFGIPVTISLFGEDAVGTTSMVIAVVVPLFNVLSVIALEIFRKSKPDFKKIIKGVIYNPLIIASVTAFILLGLNITLPTPIVKTISDVSKLATPLALILLGSSFEFSKSKSHSKQLIIGVLGRLVVVPLLFIPIAASLGFRDIELVCVLIALGAPTAVSTFTMAEQMGGDSELAGQLVVFTSGLSTVSVFFWILILKELLLI